MATMVESTFDVVNWLFDHALNDNEYLQPAKMQRLLFLAQAYWGVANHGQMLMPAVFVAGDLGPVEPNVDRVFESGRPYLETRALSRNTVHFLESLWRRFGHHSAEHLTRVLANHPPVRDALAKGKGTVIPFEAIQKFYGSVSRGEAQGDGTPVSAANATLPVEDIYRPRVMRTQGGKPVNVNKWMPPSLKEAQARHKTEPTRKKK